MTTSFLRGCLAGLLAMAFSVPAMALILTMQAQQNGATSRVHRV